jgi:Na+/proline symporter
VGLVGLGVYFYRHGADDAYRNLAYHKEVERMNPTTLQFIPVPTASATGIVMGAVALGLMLAVCILLGVAAKKKWKTFEEYLVGKREIGPWVTGAALSASYISGWAFCGSTGIVYSVGISGMWFGGIFSLVGIIPCIWLAAQKTREFSVKLGATTVPETIGRRFESKGLQTLVALSMLYFLFMYSVGQLKAAGSTWYALTGAPAFWCLLLSVFIAWLYMVLGGYVGNQYAMSVQGFIFAFVGTLIGIMALVKIGGFFNLTANLAAQNPKMMQLIRPDLPTVGQTQLFSSWVGISAAAVLFFTMAVGFPHNVSRFLGMGQINKKKDYWKLVFIVWLFTGIPIMLDCSSNGMVTRALYGDALLKIEPWKADLAAPMLAQALGGSWLLALYVAALFSAALSTLAAMVFIMSANVTKDIIKLWSPKTSDKSMLWLGYILIALFLFIQFWWTYKRPPALLAVFMGMAAMGLGAIFFFVTAMSYYWKRATAAGAICTVLFGTIGSIVGAQLVLVSKPPVLGFGTMEWILVLGCGIIYFGVSLLTKTPSKELVDKLFPPKA